MSGPARWVLLGGSVAFLARAHYVATWKSHGAWWSKSLVWLSTIVVILLWSFRLWPGLIPNLT
ncbi:MAG: hypothetical protein ACREQ9_04040 [Candidatus Binatia bacterium]